MYICIYIYTYTYICIQKGRYEEPDKDPAWEAHVKARLLNIPFLRYSSPSWSCDVKR